MRMWAGSEINKAQQSEGKGSKYAEQKTHMQKKWRQWFKPMDSLMVM